MSLASAAATGKEGRWLAYNAAREMQLGRRINLLS
jgi:hypothetical protein